MRTREAVRMFEKLSQVAGCSFSKKLACFKATDTEGKGLMVSLNPVESMALFTIPGCGKGKRFAVSMREFKCNPIVKGKKQELDGFGMSFVAGRYTNLIPTQVMNITYKNQKMKVDVVA